MGERDRQTRLKRAAQDCCPTCGAKLKDIGFWVDLQNNIVIVENRAARVTRKIAEVVFTLRKAYPHTVSIDQLIQSVWGGSSDVTDMNVRALLTQCRKVLAEFQWTIANGYGDGYRLVKR